MSFGSRLHFSRKLKLSMIFQEEIADCALACIAMIADFWRSKLHLATLRQLHHPSIQGTNVLQILAILEQIGFRGRVLRVPYQALSKVKKPAILHWDNNHFVVLKKIKRRMVIIHDPAIGVCRYPLSEVQRYFSNIVLEIEPSSDYQRTQTDPPLTVFRLLKSIGGVRRIAGLLLGLSVLFEVMNMMNPMLIQYMTDYVLGGNSLSQFYVLGLGCGLFALLQGLTEFLRQHLMLYTAIKTTDSFAADVFKYVLKLPLKFFTHRHLNDIQIKFQSIEQLGNQLSTELLPICLDGIMLVFTFIVMSLYSPVLTGVSLSAFMLYGCVLFWNIHEYKNHMSSALKLYGQSMTTFQEAVRGIATLKTFVKESLWLQLWRNDYIDALNHTVHTSTMQIKFRVLQHIIAHSDYIFILCLGGDLIVKQELTIGMLFAFLSYRTLAMSKATTFIQYLFSYQHLAVQLQRLQDLLIYPTDSFFSTHLPYVRGPGIIKVVDLEFAYSGAPVLFKKLQFQIAPGEKVAIVGPSGCGKTSLIKLLLGLEQPTKGSIFLDDWPLHQFGWQPLRVLSASVLQDDILFSGSIIDNITFFAEKVDADLLREVAQLACIHETIMSFPLGYETVIGQMNTLLSGGQKQRLLLARALYTQPQFLFLDEMMSHLDWELELAITYALKNCDMTQIIVAHRPQTIALADQIINLSEYNKIT